MTLDEIDFLITEFQPNQMKLIHWLNETCFLEDSCKHGLLTFPGLLITVFTINIGCFDPLKTELSHTIYWKSLFAILGIWGYMVKIFLKKNG